MKFTVTKLKGAYIVDSGFKHDHRGFFARTFCAQEFATHNLNPVVVQCNLAFNYNKGTLRGIHYQVSPATEAKFIRCTQGEIYNVIIDLRPESNTYLQYIGVELTAKNRRSLYVPDMFAHGYQTLTDNTEVMYQVSEYYTPNRERGLRYDDPLLGIEWPLPISEISDKDTKWSLL